jgi:hypothetical protein
MPKSIFRRLTKNILIITNVMIASLFLTGCYSELFFSAYSWPVGLLTLYSFYLLVLLMIFFIFWLFVKPAWILIFIITTALSYKHINNIVPFRFSSAFNQIKLQPRARALPLPLVLSMLYLSVIYDFADRECPQNSCWEATSATCADCEFGLKFNIAAASGSGFATSFGVVDDFSVCHL